MVVDLGNAGCVITYHPENDTMNFRDSKNRCEAQSVNNGKKYSLANRDIEGIIKNMGPTMSFSEFKALLIIFPINGKISHKDLIVHHNMRVQIQPFPPFMKVDHNIHFSWI